MSRDTTRAAGDAEAERRDGLDARQRGWFWHWNGIVTQYAPLIGLKGVGLLNSYTVWTDRREESPHRGYAFPSQQAEADFYGEERAELITINKILVALGLIEIRKEMILRTDERGRRWRVPHNLYRVRDRPEGVTLRVEDALRVAELAASDEAVFRHVRRVFSARFKPIDRDNVWHDMLDELADHPLWQGLQERTREIEERASARTRAGHRRRALRNEASDAIDEAADLNASDAVLSTTEHHSILERAISTTVALDISGHIPNETVVEHTNEGSESNVDGSNDGSDVPKPTFAAQCHNGQPGSVGPSNTTYNQKTPTTRTTTSTMRNDGDGEDRSGRITRRATSTSPAVSRRSVVETDVSEDSERGGTRGGARDGDHVREHPGAGLDAGIADDGHASVRDALSVDEGGDAQTKENGNSSGWESELDEPVARLAGVDDGGEDRSYSTDASRTPHDDRPHRSQASGEHGQRRLDRAASSSRPSGGSGTAGPLVDPDPLVVSVFEAANNRGASPLERILLGELERDANSAARAAGTTGAEWLAAAMREAVASGSSFVAPKRIREIVNRWAGNGDGPGAERAVPWVPTAVTSPRKASSVTPEGVGDNERSSKDSVDAVRLPGGTRATIVWPGVLDDISRLLDAEAFGRLLAGSMITRYWRGTVEVRVASEAAAGKLSAEYRSLVERHLNARLKRPVAVSFHAAREEWLSASTSSVDTDEPDNKAEGTDSVLPGVIMVTSTDVELGRQLWHAILDDLASDTGPDDLERLAPVVPLGQDSTGAMVLGVSSPVARRLIEGRYRNRIQQSLSGLVGDTVTIRVVADDAWNVQG